MAEDKTVDTQAQATVEADTSPTQAEDAELSGSELEGVVGGARGRSGGKDNVRADNHQSGSYGNEDDRRP